MISFLRPNMLFLFILIVPILLLLKRNHTRVNSWSKICDAHLLSALKVNSQGMRNNSMLYMLTVIWILMVICLSGPSWQSIQYPVSKMSDTVVIVLNLSDSMSSVDITPSRIKRAQFKIKDILNKFNNRRYGFIVYAKEPYVVSPVSNDINTLNVLIDQVGPSMMPVQGNNVVLALNKAKQLIESSGVSGGNILIITDEIINIDKVEKEIKFTDINISVLGVATAIGAPLIKNNIFAKDKSGKTIITKLNAIALKNFSKIEGGVYHTITTSDEDIDYIFNNMDSFDSNKIAEDLRLNKKRDNGYIILWFILPFLLYGFRKNVWGRLRE